MKRFLLTLATAIIFISSQAEIVKINITPTNAATGENTCLELHLPQGTPKGAVVICPGGAYAFKAIDHEGRDWTQWFTDRGIAAAVLDYRLPNQRSQVPLSDCSSAINTLRTQGSKWNIPSDNIGVMGFSAGGHLASTMATHFKNTDRPDFQILMYPVTTMQPGVTHNGTRHNLIGDKPSAELEKLYSNELQVSPQTPPAFIFACEDDKVVPVENSIRYYNALTAAGVPAELHVYPTGGHGFGKLPSFKYVDQMLYLLDSWLTTQVKQNRRTDINAIFIGNSITQGVIMNNPEKNAPPVQCAEILANTPGIGNVDMFNAGRSGYTTVDFLPGNNPRFNRIVTAGSNLRQKNPSSVTIFSIMLGTNDSASSGPTGSPVSDSDYKKNIALIIDSLQSNFPDAIFVLHRPVWYSSNTHNGAVYLAEGQRRLDGYYDCLLQLIEDYAASNPGHVFLGDTQAYDHFRRTHKQEMFAENGNSGIFYLHPNPAGAKSLARYWADSILRALRSSNKNI